MEETIDDFVPHYRADFSKKVEILKRVILNLSEYRLEDMGDITKEEFDIIKLSVINSIKGQLVALEEKTRQDFVEEIFLKPSSKKGNLTYRDTSREGKCDFIGVLKSGERFGLEVKGGEGNSVTLLSRPPESDIFAVWSHLDVMSNTPAENMRAVIGRIVKQMINKDEKMQKVDFLIFYDKWYLSKIKSFKKGPMIPDIFVFPSRVPTISDPNPPIPKQITKNRFLIELYRTITKVEKLPEETIARHVWFCEIRLEKSDENWLRYLKIVNAFNPKILFTKNGETVASCKPVGKLVA